MFFRKQENKKHHPYANLTLFTLAAVGVISITNKTKSFVKRKARCVMNFFKKSDERDAGCP